MSLKVYNRKRKFDQTPEPKGKAGGGSEKGEGPLRFVVQMHRATRLHFDLRLEFEGVFKSWAVPRGPSLNPQDQRLAVFVEDHPLEYGSFEGIIPPRNYGAGTVMVWDEGTYEERGSFGPTGAGEPQYTRKQNEEAMRKGFDKGHITFVMNGHKLKGEFALIRFKKQGDEKSWLLVKKRDAHSTYKRTATLDNHSVKTGRSLEEIAAQAEAQGDVWLPKRQKLSAESQRKLPLAKSSEASRSGKKPASRVSRAEEAPAVAAASRRSEPSPKPDPSLRQDPMPRKNKPMLATASRGGVVPSGDWIFEEERGGLRALAEVEGKRVRLYSKAGLSFEKKFGEIVEELKSLGIHAVLDGEILAAKGSATYSVFDVLYADGRDLRKQPLRDRKRVLSELVAGGKRVTASRELAPGSRVNGRIIAKNAESLYRAGTT
jgi:bifunctional non-homologous end joining protein LigD